MTSGKTMRLVAGLLCLLMLCTCGGGGSSAPRTVLEGVVLDGPLVGAKVCLDRNRSGVCEDAEPSTITGPNGRFALPVDPSWLQDGPPAPLLAEVGLDALDESTGQTVRNTLGLPLRMTGPARSPAVLSPITTLLDLPALVGAPHPDLDTVQVPALLAGSGLSSTRADYADPRSDMSEAARAQAQWTGGVLAAMLAQAQQRLRTEAAEVFALDARGLPGRSAEQVVAALRSTESVDGERAAQAQTRLLGALAAIPVVASHEALARRALQTVPPERVQTLWRQGLLDANALGSTPRTLQWLRLADDSERLRVGWYRSISGSWTADASRASGGAQGMHVLYEVPADGAAATARFRAISAPSASLRQVGEGWQLTWQAGDLLHAQAVTLLEKSLADLPFELVPGQADVPGHFSITARMHWLRHQALTRQYLLDDVATFFTSLAQLRSSPRTCYEGVCWSITQAPSGPLPEQAGRMRFVTTSGGGSLPLGEGRFVDEEVAGVPVLRMTAIPVAVQNRSPFWLAKDGRLRVFADVAGQLWTGHHMPAGLVWYSPPLLGRQALQDLLAAAAYPVFSF